MKKKGIWSIVMEIDIQEKPMFVQTNGGIGSAHSISCGISEKSDPFSQQLVASQSDAPISVCECICIRPPFFYTQYIRQFSLTNKSLQTDSQKIVFIFIFFKSDCNKIKIAQLKVIRTPKKKYNQRFGNDFFCFLCMNVIHCCGSHFIPPG